MPVVSVLEWLFDYPSFTQLSLCHPKINWETLTWRVRQSGSDSSTFEQIIHRMIAENIKDKRNLLAHGGAITGEIASSLRESIIGDRNKPGILCWLVEHATDQH